MAVATLSRGATSVDIRLVEEGGTPLVSATFGKPEVNVRESGGTLNPRINDRWSGLQNITLQGKLYDYDVSHDLVDLVKTASTTPLELSLPTDLYDDPITVAPAAGQAGALTVDYPAGRTDLVDVSLSLTRVGRVVGVGQQDAQTPRASGTGPIEVRVDGTTVEIPTAGLSVERSVGRPNDAVRRVPSQSDPRYEVKTKVAGDSITLAFETIESIKSTLNALTDNIFRARLGREGVTLDFNGLLGLGEFRVIPVGSSPFRQVQQAGRGWVAVPTLEFRRVYDTTA